MSSPVQKIKERLAIEEVVSSYIKLEKAGINLKARCPFHNEKTPSFFVSPNRNSYYCFGCGASGDIFTFIQEFEGLDFKSALKLLAQRAGVILEPVNQEEKDEKEKLYQVMEEATNYFVQNLLNQKEALNYLHQRGLEDKIISDFRLGYALNDWRLLYNYLKSKGFKEKEMELAGLIKKAEKNTESGKPNYYDRFRGRIMFPIFDSIGRVIAFSGRVFQNQKDTSSQTIEPAKYLNSPETPIFNKSTVLYGLNKAKDFIRKHNFSILVEGQMDLLLSHQIGYRNTIASSGTALSDALAKENVVSNLGLVRRLSENLVIAYDADEAGLKASERAAQIALTLGMDVKIITLPAETDPAEYILKNGLNSWKEVIKQAKHIIDFLLSKILEREVDVRKVGKLVREKVLPYVGALASAIERNHFLKKINEATDIPLNALEADLEKIIQLESVEKEKINNLVEAKNNNYRKEYIQKKLFGILLWQKQKESPEIEVAKILEEINQRTGELISKTLEEIENKSDLIFEAEVFYGTETDLKKDLAELIDNYEEESLREKLAVKMKELHLIENQNDPTISASILKECQFLSNKIENIKNNRLKK